MQKTNFSESDLKTVVYESVKKILKEGLFNRTRMEGNPQKASDVIRGNGWSAKTVRKDANELVLRCYKNNDAVFATDDSLPFNELVEDLNIYFEDKGSPMRAFGEENEQGSLITIRKQ